MRGALTGSKEWTGEVPDKYPYVHLRLQQIIEWYKERRKGKGKKVGTDRKQREGEKRRERKERSTIEALIN